LKGYTTKAAQEIAEFTDIGGFITATISVLGFKYIEIPVAHAEREHGESRYGILTQLDQFMSLFTGYARKPFQVIELIGLFFVFIGFVIFISALSGFLMPRGIYALLAVVISLLGMILSSIGIVGEYAVRIFKLSRKSPRYLIAEVMR
jgi:undecaprenyl-phosphate 4-deoxy-4-formamido-L-arabinose transferase